MLLRTFIAFALLLLATGCASVPGGTQAPLALQRDILEAMLQVDSLSDATCGARKVVSTEVTLDISKGYQIVVERWILDRCGERVRYHVSYTPFLDRWSGPMLLVFEES